MVHRIVVFCWFFLDSDRELNGDILHISKEEPSVLEKFV